MGCLTLAGKHQTVGINDVNPFPGNARKGNVDKIRESVREHGQYRTIVVQESTGYILAGNHTWQAMKAEGFENIDVTYVNVDEIEAKKIVLADNRLNDLAVYDTPALAELLKDLPDYEGTGFEQADVDLLLQSLAGGFGRGKDVDAVPEAPSEPQTVPGDVYTLGNHRLMCGDSTSVDDVAKLMDGAHAKLLITDPPYGVDYDGGMKKREKLKGDHVGTSIYADMMPCVLVACEERAPLYIWLADNYMREVLGALDDAGLEQRSMIIWSKNNAQFMTGAQYKNKHEPLLYMHRKGKKPYWYGPNNEVTIWEVDRSPRNDFHPTQKPVELVERILDNSSKPGDAVLDLFGGSGSTLVGCEAQGRISYTMELNPVYCDVIVARWENLTGKKAQRVGE